MEIFFVNSVSVHFFKTFTAAREIAFVSCFDGAGFSGVVAEAQSDWSSEWLKGSTAMLSRERLFRINLGFPELYPRPPAWQREVTSPDQHGACFISRFQWMPA